MTTDNIALKHALIEGYRRELRKRYQLENVRRFPVFDPISDEQLIALRNFFLEYIYPAAEDRDELDRASDRVMQMFRSPRQLLPLMGTALSTLMRFGTMIRQASSVTLTTLETLKETRKLEDRMLGYAEDHDIQPKDAKRKDTIALIVGQLPEEDMLRFRNDVLKLFRSLANIDLLAAGVEIMENALSVMRSKPRVYDGLDIEGFELGRDLLQGSLDLYSQLSDEEAHVIVDGIDAVEEDWYDEIKALAAEQD